MMVINSNYYPLHFGQDFSEFYFTYLLHRTYYHFYLICYVCIDLHKIFSYSTVFHNLFLFGHLLHKTEEQFSPLSIGRNHENKCLTLDWFCTSAFIHIRKHCSDFFSYMRGKKNQIFKFLTPLFKSYLISNKTLWYNCGFDKAVQH